MRTKEELNSWDGNEMEKRGRGREEYRMWRNVTRRRMKMVRRRRTEGGRMNRGAGKKAGRSE